MVGTPMTVADLMRAFIAAIEGHAPRLGPMEVRLLAAEMVRRMPPCQWGRA